MTTIPTTKKALESFKTEPGPSLGPGFGRRDPTASVQLRMSYARDMLSRLDKFLSIVRETVVENDALGIRQLSQRQNSIQTNDESEEEFGGVTFDQRFRGFRRWLKQLSDEVILDAEFDAQGNLKRRERWQDKYIVSAMAKGIRMADIRLIQAGVDIPDENRADVSDLIINQMVTNQGEIVPENIASAETERRTISPEDAEFPDVAGVESIGPGAKSDVIEGALATPEFAEPQMRRTLTSLAEFNFDQFKTVSRDGVPELADTLKEEIAEGIAEGRNPREIADLAWTEAKTRHQSVTRARATMISRTEVSRAHAQSTLNRYETFGSRAVQTQEWHTAGDRKVCPICSGMEGQRFPMDQARGLLPAHPSCRCTFLPVTSLSEPLPDERLERSRERVKQAGIDPDKFEPTDHIDTKFNREVIGLDGGSAAKPLSAAPQLDDRP